METDDSSVIFSETEGEGDAVLSKSLLETDNFSETPSEFYEETSADTAVDVTSDPEEEKPKAQGKPKHLLKKSKIGYQRKFDKKPTRAQGPSTSKLKIETESEDLDVVGFDDGDKLTSVPMTMENVEDPDRDQDPLHANVPNLFAQEIINNLKLLLDDAWSFDVILNKFLRVIHHNKSENAAVDYSLFWDCEKSGVGIFVHGIPVPPDSKIFYLKAVPIKDNIGSVSDYLCFLANKVLKFSICCGIEENEEIWEHMDGVVDKFLEKPCYRSSKCSMLVDRNKDRCFDCRQDFQDIERQMKREERKEKSRSKSKTFFSKDCDMTSEELKVKKDKWKERCKVAEKHVKRLQKRVDVLEVKLDKVMKDDLIGILQANVHKMTDIQRLFWESQKDALLVNDKRGLRWHPMMIRIALRLRSLSAGAIDFLRDSKIMVLPSDRTLYDYSHFVDPKEGCQEEVISSFAEKIKKAGEEDYHNYVNLMFDEMHIRCGLVTKRATGELVGYTDLSTVDEELRKLTADLEARKYKPKLAKKVLVYLAQGLTNNIQEVVAIYSTDDLSTVQLYDRTWEIIYHLEESGVKVLCLTFDGAAVNRKFIRMHSSADPIATEIYCTKNLAAGDGRILYFIVDPPHLLKTIRNALANSFSHRKTRKLWKNGEFLSWKVIEKIYELTKNDKYVTHKLTKAHITLSSFSCMTVCLATQVCSDSVANTIERLANLPSMEAFDTDELVKFIRIMNKFFDCVNGKQEDGEEVRNPNLAAYTNPDDPRLAFLSTTFLDYFEEWKKQVADRPGIFSQTERAQMIISYQALESLQISCKSIVAVIRHMLVEAKAPSINARLLNQDPLEQYFGKIRRQQGDNRNPTLKSTLDTSFNLRAQGLAAMPSKKGNTEVRKNVGLEVDDTELPKRPKKS